MIPQKTVLILGAGASVPFGFPAGKRLLKIIVHELRDSTTAMSHTLRDQGFDDNTIMTFRNALKRSSRPSVDAFLEKRPEYEAVGTAAIAAALLPCEREAMLFDYWLQAGIGRSISFRQGAHECPEPPDKGNWYESLSGDLDEEVSFENFGQANNKLSVITFNYDRSLEHYLHIALVNGYGKKAEKCAKQLRQIKILHVYGSLGKLDWQTSKCDKRVPYDSDKTSAPHEQKKYLERARNGISIFHQTKQDDAKFEEAFDLLKDAQRIYFLGFGYHKTNLQRLRIESLPPGLAREIKGTQWNLSKSTLDRLRNLGIEVTEQDTTVYDFVEHEVNLRA